jgi:hypothetical protein
MSHTVVDATGDAYCRAVDRPLLSKIRTKIQEKRKLLEAASAPKAFEKGIIRRDLKRARARDYDRWRRLPAVALEKAG